MAVTLFTRDPEFETLFQRLLDAKRESAEDVDTAVAAIIRDVVQRGDTAVIEYTRRFDGVELEPNGLCLDREEIAEAAAAVSADTLSALQLAAERIESFHRR